MGIFESQCILCKIKLIANSPIIKRIINSQRQEFYLLLADGVICATTIEMNASKICSKPIHRMFCFVLLIIGLVCITHCQTQFIFFTMKKESLATTAFGDIFKETLKHITVYLLVGWIVEFILASKDTSTGIDEKTLIFTFRTWLWIDGGTTVMLPISLIFIIKCCEQCILGFGYIYGLFKFAWIFVGFAMFVNLNFSLCSELILSFGILYFVTFWLWIQISIWLVTKSYFTIINQALEDQNAGSNKP